MNLSFPLARSQMILETSFGLIKVCPTLGSDKVTPGNLELELGLCSRFGGESSSTGRKERTPNGNPQRGLQQHCLVPK